MPRRKRQKSNSGIYHVITRGVNRQPIFEEPKDYRKYLEFLEECKTSCKFELLAFCLMTNHVHLLIRQNGDPLDKIFRKLNTSYAVWFNSKYQRTGHLFQDRYKSEPVDDMAYFLTVLRYIHQNPLKAGLEKSIGSGYMWSSYQDYIYEQGITDTGFALEVLGGKKNFFEWHGQMETARVMDMENIRLRLPDDVAADIIYEASGCRNAAQFQQLDLHRRNQMIGQILQKSVSVNQLSRLTGVSSKVIRRIDEQGKQTADSFIKTASAE